MRLSTYTPLLATILFTLSLVSCKKQGNTPNTVVGTYVGTSYFHAIDSIYLNHYGWSKGAFDTTFSDTVRILNYPKLNAVLICYRDYDDIRANIFKVDTFKYSSVDTYSHFQNVEYDVKHIRFSRPSGDSLIADYHQTLGPYNNVEDWTVMFRGQKLK